MEQTAEATQTDGQQIADALPPEAQSNDNDNAQEQKQNGERKSSYQERVDLSDLPDDKREAIESRFAHLSRLMKKNESRSYSEITKRDAILKEQSALIEELRTGVGAVVDHLQDNSLKEAEARTKAEMKAAHESGDTMAFIEANEKLAEIKARKIALEQQKKTQKPVQEKPNDDGMRASGAEAAQEAFSAGEITDDDLRAVNSWIGEADEAGNPLRSWATSRNPANPTADPVYRRAVIEMAAVFDESSPYADKPIDEKLAEIDRRMGVMKRASSQTVMGGNLTIPRKSSKMTLSPEAQRIAIKTKIAGPKASDAEHLEVYRKQMEKVRLEKGVRK